MEQNLKMVNESQENREKLSYKLPFIGSVAFVIILIVMFGITIYQFQVGLNGLIRSQIAEVAKQIERVTYKIVQLEPIAHPDFKELNAKISQQQKTLETLSAKISQQQKTLDQLNRSMEGLNQKHNESRNRQ